MVWAGAEVVVGAYETDEEDFVDDFGAAVDDAAVEDAAVEDAAVDDAGVDDAGVDDAVVEDPYEADGEEAPFSEQRVRRVSAVSSQDREFTSSFQTV